MIRIERGPEPKGLVRARQRRLDGAVAVYNAHGAPSAALAELLEGYGSPATKRKLYLAQKKKCAWCERRTDYSSSPVDHYRPKDGAWRHLPGSSPRCDPGHYWWLTWTWTNLLFACARCNDRGHKANYFPLAAGSTALPVPARPVPAARPESFFDVSKEQPLLVNPADPQDDPLDHIVWKPVRNGARRNWLWSPAPLTPAGEVTMSILKLDDAELVEEVQNHLVSRVLPSIEEIEMHLAAGRKELASGRWDQLLEDTLVAGAELSAATWCALEIWLDRPRRQESGLKEPARPGTRS